MASRCSKCREMGHNSRSCKRDSFMAEEMKRSYADALRLATTANKQRTRLILLGDLPDEGITTQVIDSRDHNGNVSFLTHDVVPRNFVRVVQNNTNNEQPVFNNKKKFPKSLVKIQELLFENSQDIPDGLYKELMDALIIKG